MRLVWLGSVGKYSKAISSSVFHMSKCDGIHPLLVMQICEDIFPVETYQKPGLLTVIVYV